MNCSPARAPRCCRSARERASRTAGRPAGPGLPSDWRRADARWPPAGVVAHFAAGEHVIASCRMYPARGRMPAAAWPQPGPPMRPDPSAISPLLQDARPLSRRPRLACRRGPMQRNAFSNRTLHAHGQPLVIVLRCVPSRLVRHAAPRVRPCSPYPSPTPWRSPSGQR